MQVLHNIFVPISIHALREEGDVYRRVIYVLVSISIHALREEGDQGTVDIAQATPISIHALREEGDSYGFVPSRCHSHFYPRPPRGGRLTTYQHRTQRQEFLSTPSARRATNHSCHIMVYARFLSTPSARRATADSVVRSSIFQISIHALREEGDCDCSF